MDRSPYLVQALQQMQDAPQAQGGQPDLAAMAKAVQQRKAWEAQNPGQSYMQRGLQQMGANIQGAPQAVAAAPGNVLSALGLGRGR